MSEITLTGISTPEGDIQKILVYFDITYNSITYHWFDYITAGDGAAAMTYLNANKITYEAAIDAKEATWVTCPKTKILHLPEGDTEVAVTKDEIVCATPTKPLTLAERITALENP